MKPNAQPISALSLSALLVTNGIPMYGVLVQDWDGLAVIILYLVESIIIGVFHSAKLFGFGIASDGNTNRKVLFTVILFLLHYNFFIYVQSVLLFGLAESYSPEINEGFNVIYNYGIFLKEPYLITIYAFIISQLAYTAHEIFITHPFKKMSIDKYMFLPYSRIFIQQFVVIIGAFLYLFSGSIKAVVVLLILLKTMAEYLGQRYGEKWIVPKTTT